jgi:hypothetical protein
MPVPDFSPGEVLTAGAMDSIGLWLVKTEAVGVTVPNVVVTDAFSANYDNYFVTYTGGVLSATTNLRMQLGASAAAYYFSLVYNAYSLTTVLANVNTNNGALWAHVGGGNTNYARVSANIYAPFLATRTSINVQYSDAANAGTGNGYLDNTTSFTAFTLSPATGTMTGGTIRVYGYRN